MSLFAQELGTAEPVSAVKLDRALAACRAGSPDAAGNTSIGVNSASAAAGKPGAAPIRPMTVSADKKLPPLKNLGALDRLFSKPG